MSRRELNDDLMMVEYTGSRNQDVLREFAIDVLEGKYKDQILWSLHTYMTDDETTYLEVMVGVV